MGHANALACEVNLATAASVSWSTAVTCACKTSTAADISSASRVMCVIEFNDEPSCSHDLILLVFPKLVIKDGTRNNPMLTGCTACATSYSKCLFVYYVVPVVPPSGRSVLTQKWAYLDLNLAKLQFVISRDIFVLRS